MTRAQEYLLKGAEEQIELAKKEIPRLYKEYNKAKASKEVFPEVYAGMMHTIGYWEGVKNTCQSVIDMLKMTDMQFHDFEMEQEKIRLWNEQMRKEILDSIKDKYDGNDNDE